MEIRPAQRTKLKLRINLSSPSGAGKSYGALLIASGLASSWEKICVIDSENGRGDLYAHFGPYRVLTLEPPFSPEKYIEAVLAAEEAGMEVIIIDSMSHEWEGLGGVLQLNDKVAQGKFRGNKWSGWSVMTPRHQRLLYTLTGSKCHIITTVRNKTETAMMEEDGKTVVKKIGVKEVQREGYEYEFMVSLRIDRETHLATPDKDNTELFEGKDPFVISARTGQMLKEWAENGVPVEEVKYINQTQYDKIMTLFTQLNLDEEDMNKLLDKYKIPTLKRLPKEDGGKIIMQMMKRVNKDLNK